MSNCLCVKIKNKYNYYPFRWNNEVLEVWNNKAWVKVIQTNEKHEGRYIYIVE